MSRIPSPTRRSVLTGLAGAGAASTLGVTAPARATARPGARTLTMRWLGTAGWRLDVPGHTLLVDPYLSRYPVGLAAGAFDATTPLSVDAEACEVVGTPRTILVTHSHWDHFNDVPHLALTHGARVFGTLTTYQLSRSLGVPTAQLAPVKGGEELDLGEYVVRVVPGLHSRTASWSVLFPGTKAEVPPPPATIADLPEGDTLSFQVETEGGTRVFLMGASDHVDSELAGLEPDVAAVAVPTTDATHDYLPRLLEGLDKPRTVVPVHWDDFETPLVNPPRTSEDLRRRLTRFVDDVRRIAPRTKVVVPTYLDALGPF